MLCTSLSSLSLPGQFLKHSFPAVCFSLVLSGLIATKPSKPSTQRVQAGRLHSVDFSCFRTGVSILKASRPPLTLTAGKLPGHPHRIHPGGGTSCSAPRGRQGELGAGRQHAERILCPADPRPHRTTCHPFGSRAEAHLQLTFPRLPLSSIIQGCFRGSINPN